MKIKNILKIMPPVLLTAIILSAVQLKIEKPMLLVERFIVGGGWVEILFLSAYAGFLFNKMLNVTETAYWRRISWNIFAVIFFTQLVLGLVGFEKFLMTGTLHFPIPGMIIAGSLYRLQIGFMPILFLVTVILSGPAWCSHLCYLGALDNQLANGKRTAEKIKSRNAIKYSLLFLLILVTIILRMFDFPLVYAVVLASIFGLVGFLVMFIFSTKSKKMVHCVSYCPVGTILIYLKKISPFRMRINSSCDICKKCAVACSYDALSLEDIKRGLPGETCSYCGDCLSSCHVGAIEYRFLNSSPQIARRVYLVVSIVLHVVFLGLARI